MGVRTSRPGALSCKGAGGGEARPPGAAHQGWLCHPAPITHARAAPPAHELPVFTHSTRPSTQRSSCPF